MFNLGRIKFYNSKNDYGFITDESGRDHFFRADQERLVEAGLSRHKQTVPFFAGPPETPTLTPDTPVLYLDGGGNRVHRWGVCPEWYRTLKPISVKQAIQSLSFAIKKQSKLSDAAQEARQHGLVSSR